MATPGGNGRTVSPGKALAEGPVPRGGWEADRERWPQDRSDGAWNQSWDQAPYADYRGGQPPSFSYDWQHAVRPQRPRSIRAAVVLMCVGAGLSGLGLIYSVLGRPWGAGDGAIPPNGGAPGLVDVASAVSGIGSAFGAVLGIALWLWLASATSAGKSGARTASTVLFMLNTLSMALFLFELRPCWHLAAGEGPLSTFALFVLSALASWVLRLSIVVLLWSKESSGYFEAKAAGW
jgi:hypothetical protein